MTLESYIASARALLDQLEAANAPAPPPELEPQPEPSPEPVPAPALPALTIAGYDAATKLLALVYQPNGYRNTLWINGEKSSVTDGSGDLKVLHPAAATYQMRIADVPVTAELRVAADGKADGATPGEAEPTPATPLDVFGSGIVATYGVSGQAPYIVHVRVPGLDLANTAALLANLYDWDFGDPGGAHNRVRGWNGAHLYAMPGTYPITLTITNPAGSIERHRLSVTVTPNSRTPIDTIPAVVMSDTELVLSGDYNRSEPIFVKGRNIVIRGGHLHWTGKNTYSPLIKLDPSCEDVIIEGVSFSSRYGGVTRDGKKVRGVQPLGRNIAVIDCRFRDIGDCINGEDRPQGLLALKNRTTAEIAGYFALVKGIDWVLLGNIVPDSWIEHCERILDGENVLSAFNTYANPGGPPSAVGTNEAREKNTIKGTWSPRRGKRLYFYHNTTGVGPLSIGPLELDDTQTCGPGVVEANTIGDGLDWWPGAHDWIVRGNTITASDAAFNVRQFDRRVERVTIEADNVITAPRLSNGDVGAITIKAVLIP